MNTFEDLSVWKLARDLRIDISKLTNSFPKSEQYRLSDQMIRASRSVSANIAEGFGRFHHKENIQFCRHSRGSLMELLEHIITATDENYISESQQHEFRDKIMLTNKVLNGYIAYLKTATDAFNSKNANN